MKYVLIKYHFKGGSEKRWHEDIANFVSALDNDPDLRGKISYRSLKNSKGLDYYHLAIVADDETVKILNNKDFFSRYTEETKRAAGGEVEVLPLELIAETSQKF